MKLRSCINRYIRYFFVSILCSLPTLFINSHMLINRFRLHLVSTIIFLIFIMVDSYKFGAYFGKHKHVKYGIIYPFAGLVLTTYICHFLIKSSRFKYLFLHLCTCQYFGIPRFLSMTIIYVVAIGLMSLCLYMGKRKFYRNL